MSVAQSADTRPGIHTLDTTSSTNSDELFDLVDAVEAADFALPMIAGGDPAGLDRCEFCPDLATTGDAEADAVAYLCRRLPGETYTYRSGVCGGCAVTVARGLLATWPAARLWVEVPA